MALAMNPVFKGRDFISIHDFNPDEIAYILQFALQLKKMQQEGKPHPVLAGKTLGMLFRSRPLVPVSFRSGHIPTGRIPLF